jgi:hypothetical protein
MRPKLDLCALCGDAKVYGESGYIFTDEGKEILCPWCEIHIEGNSYLANPLFESKVAMQLFQKKHPKLWKAIESDNRVIFMVNAKVRNRIREVLR